MQSNYPPGVTGNEDYFNPPEGVVEDCPGCDGKGEWKEDGEPVTCPECEGEGFKETFPEEVDEILGDEKHDAMREDDFPK